MNCPDRGILLVPALPPFHLVERRNRVDMLINCMLRQGVVDYPHVLLRGRSWLLLVLLLD